MVGMLLMSGLQLQILWRRVLVAPHRSVLWLCAILSIRVIRSGLPGFDPVFELEDRPEFMQLLCRGGKHQKAIDDHCS